MLHSTDPFPPDNTTRLLTLAQQTTTTPEALARAYLLIDCSLQPSIYAAVHAAMPPTALRSLVTAAGDPSLDLLRVSPLLVDISSISNADDLAWLALASGQPMVNLLLSDLDLAHVQEQLARNILVDAAGDTMVLRFADTRILPALLQVLRPEQRHDFLSPVRAWHYLNRRSEWCAVPMDDREEAHTAPVIDALLSLPRRLSLDDTQFGLLVDACTADAYIHNSVIPAEILPALPSRRHACIQHLLDTARTAGLHAHADLVAWILNGLQSSAQLEKSI